MIFYTIALFFHIVGALGFFIALGLEWTGLRQIRNAMTVAQVQGWLPVLGSLRKIGMTSMLTIIIFGIYLTAAAWGMVAWIIVAVAALILEILIARWFIAPRMAAVRKALPKENGQLTTTFHSLVNSVVLWIFVQTRVAIGLGIIFLMTVKPGLVGSLLTLGVAILLGFVSALPIQRHERMQARKAE